MQNPIGHVAHSFFEYVAQVAAGTEVCRSKEIHSALVSLEVIALAETGPCGVIRIIYGYTQTSLLTHNGEAGYIGGAVAEVYHVLKGNGAQVAVHVVVHILRVFYHTLIDTEEELGFGGVRNYSLREADAAVLLAELTGENFLHVRSDNGAVDDGFNAAGNDIKLDMYAGKAVLGGEHSRFKLIEKFGNTSEECELLSKFSQSVVAYSIDAERIEQFFQIAEFAIPPFLATALVALLPKEFGIDTELGEDGVLLHVVRTEGLVEIKDESNCILGNGHG